MYMDMNMYPWWMMCQESEKYFRLWKAIILSHETPKPRGPTLTTKKLLIWKILSKNYGCF